MPELPEVEHARKCLQRWLGGATIAQCRVLDPRIVRGGSATSLTRGLTGRRVLRVERRGKWLRMPLDDGAVVFSHLGMTGKWVVEGDDEPVRFEKLLSGLYLGGVESTVDPPTRLLIGHHLAMSTRDLAVLQDLEGDAPKLRAPKQLSVEYVGEQFERYLSIPGASPTSKEKA